MIRKIKVLLIILVLQFILPGTIYSEVIDKDVIQNIFYESSILKSGESKYRLISIDSRDTYTELQIPPTLLKDSVFKFTFTGTKVNKTALCIDKKPDDIIRQENYSQNDLPIRTLNDARLEKRINFTCQSSSFSVLALKNLGEHVLYFRNLDPSTRFKATFTFLLDDEKTIQWLNSKDVPSQPELTPHNGILHTSPVNLNVQSYDADQVYYLMKSTISDSGIPDDPDITNMTPDENDMRVNGDIALEAARGTYKKVAIALRGKNEQGWSDVATYRYSIDRLPRSVGQISNIVPNNESEIYVTKGTSLDIHVACANSSEIRFVSLSDSRPDIIPEISTTDVMNSEDTVNDGNLTLKTKKDETRYYKVRFIGYNENNPAESQFGPPSATYIYKLTGEEKEPGKIEVNPAKGSFDQPTLLQVRCANADKIFYRYTLDGTPPSFSEDMYMVSNINGPEGTFKTPYKLGEKRTLRLIFKGYNSDTKTYGPVSTNHSYEIDLRSGQTDPPQQEPPGDDPTMDQQTCEANGGTWISVFGRGLCQGGSGNEVPSPNYYTEQQAIDNPGKNITDHIYDTTGICDPGKKFFSTDQEVGLSIFDIFQSYFANDQSESSNQLQLGIENKKIRLQLDLENGQIFHLFNVQSIQTTDEDGSDLMLDPEGNIQLRSDHLILSFQSSFYNWDAVQNALESYDGISYNANASQEHRRKNTEIFNVSSLKIGQDEINNAHLIIGPSYSIENESDSCTVGDFRTSNNNLAICYDSSGKWQYLIPYVVAYDDFKNSMDQTKIAFSIDPFTGNILFETPDASWIGLPSYFYLTNEQNAVSNFSMRFNDDMNGHGFPDLIIQDSEGNQQVIQTLRLQ